MKSSDLSKLSIKLTKLYRDRVAIKNNNTLNIIKSKTSTSSQEQVNKYLK